MDDSLLVPGSRLVVLKGYPKLGAAPGSAQGNHMVLGIKLGLTTNKARALIPQLLIFIYFGAGGGREMGGGAHLVMLGACDWRVRSCAQRSTPGGTQGPL